MIYRFYNFGWLV